MLPDVLVEDLRVVFCGAAPGNVSEKRQQYYANPTNKFWRVLFETGLTERVLAPSEFRTLLAHGFGLTDLVKGRSGVDKELKQSDFDTVSFNSKVRTYHPSVVCFNGKKASKIYFSMDSVEYGFHELTIGDTRFFTAPSTSGSANRYWDIQIWQGLADWILSSTQ